MTRPDDAPGAAMVEQLLGRAPRASPSAGRADRLSVVVRTQGKRPDLLDEALACLAAQSVEALEVLLVVHDDDPDIVSEVERRVDRFAPPFSARVSVISVTPGKRGKPLNAGLDAATGTHVAFLDDDDVVTGNWAEVFLSAAADAPGRVIRSVTADQRVRRIRGTRAPYFEPIGPIEITTGRTRFDLLEHFDQNRTPICAYAVPLAAIRALGIRFDEDLDVMEDWLFLVQAGLACGIVDTGEVTAIYRRWDDEEATWHQVDEATWKGARRRVWEILDASPLLMPPGSIGSIRELRNRVKAASRRSREDAARIEELERTIREHAERIRDVESERDRALRRLRAVESSTSWRLTAPIRRLLDALRGRR